MQCAFRACRLNRKIECRLCLQDLFGEQNCILHYKAPGLANWIRIIEIEADERNGDEKRNRFCATLSSQMISPEFTYKSFASFNETIVCHFIPGLTLSRDRRVQASLGCALLRFLANVRSSQMHRVP